MASRDPNRWMWAEALQMLDEANRLQRRFFEVSVRPSAQPRWEPPVDMFETERELCIIAALPGVAPEAVRVEIEGEILMIAGVRPLPSKGRDAHIVRLEIPYGRFERRITLSSRLRLAAQDLRNGCLLLTFTKL